MAELGFVITSGVKAERKNMGGKAAALAALGSGGFVIPEWFAVSPRAFLSCLSQKQLQALEKGEATGVIRIKKSVRDEITAAVTQLLADKEQLLAVRSSATAEDGENASFAGQLQSYLNVPAEKVVERVRDVWYSAFTEHVHRYRNSMGHSEGWIPAVLVQRMVNADVAGVAFSVDPVTGNRNRCVINATTGVADRLVSGEVNGDTYYTSRDGVMTKQVTQQSAAILTAARIAEIVKLLLKVEQHFGLPQDIEWAMEGETLYLLQARPITSLKQQSLSGNAITIWDNSNIVESYSGVTSPLTYSFARYVYEHVYIEFAKIMGVEQAKIEQEADVFRNMLGFVNGHIYYNLLNWYRGLALFPGFKMNRKFMEQMMGVKESLPEEVVKGLVPEQFSLWERLADSLSVVRMLSGLVWQQVMLGRTISCFYNRLEMALSTSETLTGLPLDRLAGEYRTLEGRLLRNWDAPLINDFLCMIAFGVSRGLLQKYAGDAGLALHNDIMIGQGDIISAEPAARIARMARIAAADEQIVARLIAGERAAVAKIPALAEEFDAYLEKFGDRCLQELKLESPTLHDDPTMLVQAIGFMARREDKQRQEAGNIKSGLAVLMKGRPLRRWLIAKAAAWAKGRVRDRENLRFERTRVFGRVRQIMLEIGRRLHELKYIDQSRDIFFLEISEIMGAIEGSATTMNLAAVIEIRKQQHETFESRNAPPNRFEMQGASCHFFNTMAYDTGVEAGALDAGAMQGIGCCQGVVKATVRVITNPRGAQLQAGEIMVARFTDPGWITLFANASGILVERGSLLSHSAIVAREMGIPAIVALDGVMSWLKSGDIVEMNGATGVVKRVTREGEHDQK